VSAGYSQGFFEAFETLCGQNFSRRPRLGQSRVSQTLVDVSYGRKTSQYNCKLPCFGKPEPVEMLIARSAEEQFVIAQRAENSRRKTGHGNTQTEKRRRDAQNKMLSFSTDPQGSMGTPGPDTGAGSGL